MLSPVRDEGTTLWKRVKRLAKEAEGGAAPSVRGILECLLPLVGKHLERVREIGRGGMGAVELIHDRNLERDIARKIIHPRLRNSAWMVGSFIREAQITAQLEHPNIVPVHEIGRTEDGRVYFSMRRVQGEMLDERIERLASGTPMGEHLLDLLDVMIKVCDALSLAHSRGVVHCDLKPQNILVGDFGDVYLMDWGISRVQRDEEMPKAQRRAGTVTTTVADDGESMMMGTPAYMSPEQARGEKPTAASDIFSVGGVIYHIVTGRPPYAADSATGMLDDACHCRFESPVAVAGSELVPLELNRIALKAMAERPRDRYANVTSLKADLVRFMRGGGDFPREAYLQGEHVIRQGEVGDNAYVVISGRCEVYKRVAGKRVHLRTMHSGDAFGETAILASTTRTASVVCLEDTVVMVINRRALEKEVEHMKPWMGAVIRTLARQANGPEPD